MPFRLLFSINIFIYFNWSFFGFFKLSISKILKSAMLSIFETYILEFSDSYDEIDIEFKSSKATLHLSFEEKFLTDDSCIIPEGPEIQIVKYTQGTDCREQKIPMEKGKKIRITDSNNPIYAIAYTKVNTDAFVSFLLSDPYNTGKTNISDMVKVIFPSIIYKKLNDYYKRHYEKYLKINSEK